MGYDETLAVVDLLFRAIEAGDVDCVRDEVYSAETVVWHNFDNQAQSAAENIGLLRQVVGSIRDMRYEVVQRYPIEGGLVQQHVLHGVTPSGRPFELPACMVIKVSDGRVTRIDEYLDSAQLGALQA